MRGLRSWGGPAAASLLANLLLLLFVSLTLRSALPPRPPLPPPRLRLRAPLAPSSPRSPSVPRSPALRLPRDLPWVPPPAPLDPLVLPPPRLDAELPEVPLRISPPSLQEVALELPLSDHAPDRRGAGLPGPGGHELEEVDQAPLLVHQVKPPYPLRARREGVEGFVVVRFLVDASGRVREARVVRADPPGFFEKAALGAVRRWRFVPGKVAGRPVDTWVVVRIRFQLERT